MKHVVIAMSVHYDKLTLHSDKYVANPLLMMMTYSLKVSRQVVFEFSKILYIFAFYSEQLNN